MRDLVPVPAERDRGEGWSVVEFLDGVLLEEAPQYVGGAAEALARIGSVEFETPDLINADGSITSFVFGGKSFSHMQLENAEVLRWIGQEAAESVLAILENEADRRAELGAENRLVHGDYNATHILVHDGGVSGVLDWEFSISGMCRTWTSATCFATPRRSTMTSSRVACGQAAWTRLPIGRSEPSWWTSAATWNS